MSIKRDFTVGICATADARGLGLLVSRVLEEIYPNPLSLRRVIIVASACTLESLSPVRELSFRDNRVVLIEEEERHGKAEAINKIIENAQGDYLVFVNSDAYPEKRSITRLLQTMNKDPSIGIISACPVFNSEGGLTSKVLRLMWLAHNECSKELNDMHVSNHCSDELMAIRSSALHSLPDGLVNDGAFMANMAKQDGYLVKFCERSKVNIDVPKRLFDLLRQRRRINYGHLQVWRLTGIAPKTLESMLLSSPLTSLRVLMGVLGKHPELIIAMPVGVIEEILAMLLAIKDNIFPTKSHGVWIRYED